MTGARALVWAPIPGEKLNIDATLRSGQTFRWLRSENGDWLGPIGGLAVRIRAQEDGFWWQTYPEAGRWDEVERYFALDLDLERLYREWIAAEPRIEPAVRRFAGLRIVRQEPEEAFFSFQCASCNTMLKITRTIRALEVRAGEPIAELDGQTIYRFPSPAAISGLNEPDLRSDLWGYRAPRLLALAGHVRDMGGGWLQSLRTIGYRGAQTELTSLFGIGAKIADCICVFGLGYDEAVPIDTHIRRIGVELFLPDLASRTLTEKVYWQLGDLFRERFGPYAGWAQQYLFLEDVQRRGTAA